MKSMLVREKIFPIVHKIQYKVEMRNAATKSGLFIPIARYDEGLGDPASFNTNPEHASFTTVTRHGCYPESKIFNTNVIIRIGFLKQAYETDKLFTYPVFIIPIYTNFLEDLTALNDLTSEDVEDIVLLQHETTDRQTYPIYNAFDCVGDITTMDATEPGLTTDAKMEYLTITAANFQRIFDGMRYFLVRIDYEVLFVAVPVFPFLY